MVKAPTFAERRAFYLKKGVQPAAAQHAAEGEMLDEIHGMLSRLLTFLE